MASFLSQAHAFSQRLWTWSCALQALFCLALGCRWFDEIGPSMSEASRSEGCLPMQWHARQLRAVWFGKPCNVSDRWFPRISILCLKTLDKERNTGAVQCCRLACCSRWCSSPSVTYPYCTGQCEDADRCVAVLSLTNCASWYWI